MQNYIKIIDNYDNKEVFLVCTDFTKTELENELSLIQDEFEGDIPYEDALIKVQEKFPEKKLEIIYADEIYI